MAAGNGKAALAAGERLHIHQVPHHRQGSDCPGWTAAPAPARSQPVAAQKT